MVLSWKHAPIMSADLLRAARRASLEKPRVFQEDWDRVADAVAEHPTAASNARCGRPRRVLRLRWRGNKGVGDVEKILGSNRCGVLVPGLTENDLAAAARRALGLIEGERVPEAVRESCRATAEKHFALDKGVERYFSIYQSLASAELESEHPVAMELG